MLSQEYQMMDELLADTLDGLKKAQANGGDHSPYSVAGAAYCLSAVIESVSVFIGNVGADDICNGIKVCAHDTSGAYAEFVDYFSAALAEGKEKDSASMVKSSELVCSQMSHCLRMAALNTLDLDLMDGKSFWKDFQGKELTLDYEIKLRAKMDSDNSGIDSADIPF